MPSALSSSKRGEWIIPAALFFAAAWLLTFNAAYVNGDDVLPMAKTAIRNVFVPNFKHAWVPNRLLDAYGRDLLAAGFDLGFFALRTLGPVDFFTLYKAYVASVYALFLTVVLCYMHRPARNRVGPVDDAVLWCLLAVMVLGLYPWRNQTHFIAYQLPSFLCFVLLNEIARMLVTFFRNDDRAEEGAMASASSRSPSLILLAFICAFSLEAYAAIVLLSLLLPAFLVTRAMARSRRASGGNDAAQARLFPLALVLVVAVVFCAVGVCAALALSERVLAGTPTGGIGVDGVGEIADAWLFTRRGVIAVLLCAIPVVVAALLGARALGRRWVASHSAGSDEQEQGLRDPQTWIYLAAVTVVVLSSVTVTAAISMKAGFDYFAHTAYPWGAFLLVAKLFATYTAVVLALGIPRRKLALRSACVLLGFIVASKGALDVFGSTHASYRTSEQLGKVYRSLGTDGGVITDSGLALSSIPMQVRPLPTVDSPEWYVAAFGRFFEKYYGVATRPLFR